MTARRGCGPHGPVVGRGLWALDRPAPWDGAVDKGARCVYSHVGGSLAGTRLGNLILGWAARGLPEAPRLWNSGSEPQAVLPAGHWAVPGGRFGFGGWELLLGSSEWRPGMSLNILQCPGQPPPQRMSRPRMSVVLRVRRPVWRKEREEVGGRRQGLPCQARRELGFLYGEEVFQRETVIGVGREPRMEAERNMARELLCCSFRVWKRSYWFRTKIHIKQIRPALETEEKTLTRCAEAIRMDVTAGLRWRPPSAFTKAPGWSVEWEGSCSCVLGRKPELCHSSFAAWLHEVRGTLRVWFSVLCLGEATRAGGWEGQHGGTLWLVAECPSCFVSLNIVPLILAFRRLAANGATVNFLVSLIRFG